MMYIGIDLGTSAAKFLLLDDEGQVQNTVTMEYPLRSPVPVGANRIPSSGGKPV